MSCKIFSHLIVLVIFFWDNGGLHTVLGQDQTNPLLSYEVIYNWQQLDFQFESASQREDLIKSEHFIPQNNVITGIKVSGKRVFLTVPRWRNGVPATLVNLPLTSGQPPAYQNVTNGPALIPYPSWKMNELGNCSAFQYVQSMEIDQFHRMWVVDVGRVNIFGEPDNKCPPKLVLLDLKTNGTLKTYEFPADVVSRNSSFLNDIVVGCKSKEDCWAYITDARDSRIIVYNLKQNKSWFVKHPSMMADKDATQINIQGENYTLNTSVDGIALSPIDTNFSRLFYSPLSSFELFSVSTADLQKVGDSNAHINGTDLEDSKVKNHGTKSSQTDGMVIDNSGVLFFGQLGNSAVNSWNTSYANLTDKNQPLLVQNDIDLQWPDTFSIDEKGYVFLTTNRLQRYFNNTYDFDEINFRVIRFFVGLKSYMYSKSQAIGQNPQAEPEPETEPEPESEPTVSPSQPEPEAEAEAESEPEPNNKNGEGKPIVNPHDNKTRYDVEHHSEHHDHEEHSDNSITGRQIHQSNGASPLFNSVLVSLVLSIAAQSLVYFSHNQ